MSWTNAEKDAWVMETIEYLVMMTLSRLNKGDMESEEDPLHHGAAHQEEPEADGGHHPQSVMPTCNVCDKQFKTKSVLTRHMKIHVEGKFVCDKCGKKFKSDDLNCHYYLNTFQGKVS